MLGTPDRQSESIFGTDAALSPLRLHPTCIPTRAYRVPSGPGWVHEVKHDGYRLQVRRVGDQVRLFTRRGYDWSVRYPAIAVTATLLRARSFMLDGERSCARTAWPR
jgi:ATP-dependent DNA ligase